jgi:hypothetical protein
MVLLPSVKASGVALMEAGVACDYLGMKPTRIEDSPQMEVIHALSVGYNADPSSVLP